jgi:uncharacterized protein YbbK (DUF523 family)
MAKILVSACLLGCKVRYNGSDVNVDETCFDQLARYHDVIAFCPEVSAGLPTPRPAAEIQEGSGIDVLQGKATVIGTDGVDVSDFFCRGAEMALQKCKDEGISLAILTESSPSCGRHSIYDGGFSGGKKPGQGVTTALLSQHGNKVYSQYEVCTLMANLPANAR